MTETGDQRLDETRWQAWYSLYAVRLNAFLRSVLRDSHAAEEVLQATFAKALTHGGSVCDDRAREWLFQVGYREALVWRRRLQTSQKSQAALCDLAISEQQARLSEQQPDLRVERIEEVERIRRALRQLPPEQRDVVERRIDREQPFREIAAECGLPIGTVLTRMRLALARLRALLERNESQ